MLSWRKGSLRPRSRTTQSSCRRPITLEELEPRCLPSVNGYRPIDEVGNNPNDASLGTANTRLLRISPEAYTDNVGAPSLANDLGPRVISDILNNQAVGGNSSQDIQTNDQKSLSDFGYAWGQFIDHDMDLTPTNPADALTIAADPKDPSQMGDQTFFRSVFDPSTGTTSPRQQINAVTSFLDLSQVYGSTAAIADALRTHVRGLLKTSPGNMLPYDNSTYFTADQLKLFNLANDAQAVPTQNLFVTGDVRGNENIELTALQTLFVRSHNQITAELQALHPDWTDEQLYQEARKLNIAEYQSITYTAYLPDLLGPGALPRYTGYDSTVNPSIATEFSTVAFRFGHSLLSGGIERHGNNGQDVLPNDPAGASISLATDFFDPNLLNPQGVMDSLTGHISTDIGPILKADADQLAQADDLLAINEVRDLLFANGGLTNNGQDLIARDVERARDDGIGSYNQVRQYYGLQLVTSFADITKNVQVQKELAAAYPGGVNTIDPFEGGLAEDHAPGSDLGPLFTHILADQFTRLRNGDHFFYQNETLTPEELRLFSQGNTLAKVIEANTGITNLQTDVFRFTVSISGTVHLYQGGASPFWGRQDYGTSGPGLAGITVQLRDTSGNVLATTVTNRLGQYSFNQLSGPQASPASNFGVSQVGSYEVVLVLPPAWKQLTHYTNPIQITRGSAVVRGWDFELALAFDR
jgi:hypothetical protein